MERAGPGGLSKRGRAPRRLGSDPHGLPDPHGELIKWCARYTDGHSEHEIRDRPRAVDGALRDRRRDAGFHRMARAHGGDGARVARLRGPADGNTASSSSAPRTRFSAARSSSMGSAPRSRRNTPRCGYDHDLRSARTCARPSHGARRRCATRGATSRPCASRVTRSKNASRYVRHRGWWRRSRLDCGSPPATDEPRTATSTTPMTRPLRDFFGGELVRVGVSP